MDGCVHVTLDSDGLTYPLLWPSGTVVSASDPTQIDLPNGSVSLIQIPENFSAAIVEKSLLSNAVERGDVLGWDQCVAGDVESILVLTSAGEILISQ